MAQSRLTKLLKQCVGLGKCEFTTYGDFGERFGLGTHARVWANKRLLDQAAKECKEDPEIRLDLTYLLRNKDKRFPSFIEGEPFDPGNHGQIECARAVADMIIVKFSLGTKNPYR